MAEKMISHFSMKATEPEFKYSRYKMIMSCPRTVASIIQVALVANK